MAEEQNPSTYYCENFKPRIYCYFTSVGSSDIDRPKRIGISIHPLYMNMETKPMTKML
jgi:hypothetical protein